jgi:hypothetical protein
MAPKVAASERVIVPKQIAEWKASPALRGRAAVVQAENRAALQAAFGRGLAAVGYELDGEGNGVFLLGNLDNLVPRT